MTGSTPSCSGFPGGLRPRLPMQETLRHTGSIPGSGRSPGGGHGNPLQYSSLENPTDRGAWRATAHGVPKSRTRLSDLAHTSSSSPRLCLWEPTWETSDPEGRGRGPSRRAAGSWRSVTQPTGPQESPCVLIRGDVPGVRQVTGTHETVGQLLARAGAGEWGCLTRECVS